MSIQAIQSQVLNTVPTIGVKTSSVNVVPTVKGNDEASFSANKNLNEPSQSKNRRKLIHWDSEKFHETFKNSLMFGALVLIVSILGYGAMKKK